MAQHLKPSADVFEIGTLGSGFRGCLLFVVSGRKGAVYNHNHRLSHATNP